MSLNQNFLIFNKILKYGNTSFFRITTPKTPSEGIFERQGFGGNC
jgi:hypothetical protein